MTKTKKVMGLTALGIGAYLVYRNKDKIMDVANNVAHMMNKDYKELEDMFN